MARITLPGRGAIDLDVEGADVYGLRSTPAQDTSAISSEYLVTQLLPEWDATVAYSRGIQVRYNTGTSTDPEYQIFELLSTTDTGTTPGTDSTVWAKHSETPHFSSINFGSLNVPASEHGATLQINHSNGINFTQVGGSTDTIEITFTGSSGNLSDVDYSGGSPSTGQILEWNGTDWVPGTKSSGIDSVTDGTNSVNISGGEDLTFGVGSTNERSSVTVTETSGNPVVTVSTAIPDATATTGGIITDSQAAQLNAAITPTALRSDLGLALAGNTDLTLRYDGTVLGTTVNLNNQIDTRIASARPTTSSQIDSSWLPDISYGDVRTFDAGAGDLNAAIARRNRQPVGFLWHRGDLAVLVYNNESDTQVFIYTGTDQTTAGPTQNSDWHGISMADLSGLLNTNLSNVASLTPAQQTAFRNAIGSLELGTTSTTALAGDTVVDRDSRLPTGTTTDLFLQGQGTAWNSITAAQLRTAINVEDGAQANVGTDLTYTAGTRTLASSTGTDTTLPVVSGGTGGTDGLMSSGDKDKLDGIATGAEVNEDTNLSYTASTRTLASSTGTDAVLPEATTTAAGLMSSTDKTKLDGVETGATADQTANEIITSINDAGTTGRISVSRLDAEVVDRDHIALFWDATGNDPNNLELPHVVVSGARTDLELTTVQNFLEMGGKGWVANRRYFPGDVVVDNGGTGTDWRPYIALTDHESETGRPAADTTNWTLMTFSMDNLSDFRGYQDQSGTSHTSLVAALDQDIITVNNTGTTSDPVYQWVNEDRGTMLRGAINTAHPNADISVTQVDGLLSTSTTGSGKNVLFTLQDGSVNEARLADNAVSVPKIDDGTRTPTAGYAVTVDGTDTTQFAYAPLQNKVSDDTGLYGLNHFDNTSTNDFSDLFDNTFFPGGGANAPGAGQFSIWHHPTEGINGRGIIINPTDATSPTAIDFEAVLDRAIANEIEIHWVFSIPSQGLHVECQTREGGLRTKYDGLGGSFAPFNGSFAFQFDYIGRNLFTGGYTTSGNFTTTFVEVNHKLVVTVDEIQHGPNSRVLATNSTGTVGWDQITTAMIADDAVTTAQIADDAVTQAQVGDDAIGRDQLDFVSTATTTAGRVVALRGDNELDAIQVSGGTAGHIAADSITYDELHFETGQTETAGRLLALGDPATGQFRTIDMGTLGQDNNLIFSDIGSGTTATLEQYIDETGTTQNVRSAAITGGQFVITIASFTPSASLIRTPSAARLNWDVAATQVRVDVDNPDGVSRYVAGIRGLFLDGGTADQRANFTLGAASQVPAAGVDYTIDITPGTLQFAPVDGSGTILSSGLTGGTSRVVVTMNDNDGNEVTGLGLDTTFTWNSPSASISLGSRTGSTFLQTYTTIPYTVGQNNIGAANTAHVVSRSGVISAVSNSSGSGTATFSPARHKDNLGDAYSVSTAPTFTRPRAVTGAQYTATGATVSDSTATISFTYPSLTLFTDAGINVDRAAVVSGSGFESAVSQQNNQQRSWTDLRANNEAGSDTRIFWVGIRSSLTQPTNFTAGTQALKSSVTPTTVTVGLEPDSPPSGYTAENYTFYGFNVGAGTSLYIDIS